MGQGLTQGPQFPVCWSTDIFGASINLAPGTENPEGRRVPAVMEGCSEYTSLEKKTKTTNGAIYAEFVIAKSQLCHLFGRAWEAGGVGQLYSGLGGGFLWALTGDQWPGEAGGSYLDVGHPVRLVEGTYLAFLGGPELGGCRNQRELHPLTTSAPLGAGCCRGGGSESYFMCVWPLDIFSLTNHHDPWALLVEM